MSDTPITDAHIRSGDCATLTLTRRLERELAASRARVASLEAERDRLRFDLKLRDDLNTHAETIQQNIKPDKNMSYIRSNEDYDEKVLSDALAGFGEVLPSPLERDLAAARQRIAALEADRDRLREALDGLCDYCGPPPVLYEEQWKEAMAKANAVLAATKP